MSEPDAVPLPRAGEVFFDVRGEARTMRLSWYADSAVAVFSIWQGNRCTGTFRLPFEDLGRMVDTLRSGPPAAAGGWRDPANHHADREHADYPAGIEVPERYRQGASAEPADYPADGYGGLDDESGGYDDGGWAGEYVPVGEYPAAEYDAAAYGAAGYGAAGYGAAGYGAVGGQADDYGIGAYGSGDSCRTDGHPGGAGGYEPATAYWEQEYDDSGYGYPAAVADGYYPGEPARAIEAPGDAEAGYDDGYGGYAAGDQERVGKHRGAGADDSGQAAPAISAALPYSDPYESGDYARSPSGPLWQARNGDLAVPPSMPLTSGGDIGTVGRSAAGHGWLPAPAHGDVGGPDEHAAGESESPAFPSVPARHGSLADG